MDQAIRNKLRGVVTQCRRLLEDSVSQELQGKFGIYAARKDDVQVDDESRMWHLGAEDRAPRKDILDHLDHIKARGFKPKEALDQLVREVAFTHLNRLCAYKMMEARQVYVGDQRFREAVSRGVNSNGVKFFLAEHPDDERLFTSGKQDVAYRHFLDWLGGLLSEEIGVLFSPHDPANRLYPPQRVLDAVLALINDETLADIWTQDETIGWVYQYFTPKELRDQARKESQAPRNSYELAFRNQFFTPRYVVEFLTDNTLGRIWYEMRKGDTKLKDQCRYMVRRPSEVFLAEGQKAPEDAAKDRDDLPREELLKLPVYIPHRPKKDPRELKILDPACGSGHFLLYCFDLLLTIYEEAYTDPAVGPALKRQYPTLDALRRDVPRLILGHNLHGIEIDLRASQISALVLWLRCHRAYQDMGLKKDRPKITRSNFVCAEPMPGEEHMLKEFVGQIEPKLLGQLVEVVFDKMKVAGEAGSLLKIEDEIRDAVAEARREWLAGPVSIQRSLFDDDKPVVRQQRFDFSGITDAQFFEQAEVKVVDALRNYAEKAQNSQRLQRRLFSEDSERGFGFVDLCHKRFDAVLMNPPFGKRSEKGCSYYEAQYGNFKSDIGLAFVDHFSQRLTPLGMLGAITSRTFLAGASFDEWRRDVLLSTRPIQVLLDLGIGVLDEALVETCAYVMGGQYTTSSTFIRALEAVDKERGVHNSFVGHGSGLHLPVFTANVEALRAFPMSVMAYWLPSTLTRAVADFGTLQSIGAATKHGVQTTDDFQFIRLTWEVPLGSISRHGRWPILAKGGEYCPYYDTFHLCVDWMNDGGKLKEYLAAKRLATQGSADWTPWMNSHEDYFKPGLTYPSRTASDFCPRVLPRGCVFTEKGQAILFPRTDQALGYLSGAFSRPFKVIVDAFVCSGDNSVSGSAANSYRTGLVNALPVPTDVFDENAQTLGRRAVRVAFELASRDELSLCFVGRPVPFHHSSLRSYAADVARSELEHGEELLGIAAHSETLAQSLLSLPETVLREFYGPLPTQYPDEEPDDELPLTKSEEELVSIAVRIHGPRRQLTKKSYVGNRRLELLCHIARRHPRAILRAFQEAGVWAELFPNVAADEMSLCVGCAFRRWDVRILSGQRQVAACDDPFETLPSYSPAMLNGEQEGSLAGGADAYPLKGNVHLLLVDDAEHPNDIVRHVRDVLDAIWKERSGVVEKEALESLGVKDLRDYFRRPGKGGFWDDHVSRYSKSRRKAPIYWLVQSSKKNYALWLYYHRLDKDLLFKALVNYVEPKIRLEESRLETLRSQKAGAGGSGRDAKRLGKEVERQEEFLSELRDFEDKLRRAANLHLEPDLNDGVVLNIAPLWELVPWKEAKNFWEELVEGKYEWSSIGKQLRAREIVK